MLRFSVGKSFRTIAQRLPGYILHNKHKAPRETNVLPPRIAPPYITKLEYKSSAFSRNSICLGNGSKRGVGIVMRLFLIC